MQIFFYYGARMSWKPAAHFAEGATANVALTTTAAGHTPEHVAISIREDCLGLEAHGDLLHADILLRWQPHELEASHAVCGGRHCRRGVDNSRCRACA